MGVSHLAYQNRHNLIVYNLVNNRRKYNETREDFYLATVLGLFTLKMSAQAIHITGSVSKSMKETNGQVSGKMPLSVPIYIFDNKAEARKQAQLYNSQNGMSGSIVKIKSNDVVIPRLRRAFRSRHFRRWCNGC